MWTFINTSGRPGPTAVSGSAAATRRGLAPWPGRCMPRRWCCPSGQTIPGLDDSKKLTERKREALFPVIQEKALAWAVARVEAAEIDETDILSARMKAMQLAVDQLDPPADFALVDGNRDHGHSFAITTPHRCIVKGDSLSASIAAASVLAKVSRDHYMLEMAQQYPQYRFEQHKGYGTKLHYEMLRTYGPSPIHRRTFLKNL